MKKFMFFSLTIFSVFFLSSCTKQTTTNELSITVFDSEDASYLADAIKKYEKKNSGVKIIINNFTNDRTLDTKTIDSNGNEISMPSKASSDARDEFRKTVATELASGGGSDLYNYGYLTWYKLAKNGYIEDLGEYMKKDQNFNRENYYMNIVDGLKFNDKNYVMPITFGFKALFADNTKIDIEKLKVNDSYTYRELMEIYKKLDNLDSSKLKAFRWDMGFYYMMSEDSSKFIDLETGSIDFRNGYLEMLLNEIKPYEEKGYLLPRNVSFTQSLNTPSLFSQMFADSDIYKNDNPIVPNHSFISLVKDDSNRNIFDNSDGFFINSNSKQKELAWDFLKFLMDEEVQISISSDYIARINKKALRDFSVKNNLPDFDKFEESINKLEYSPLYDPELSVFYTAKMIEYIYNNSANSPNDIFENIEPKIKAYLSSY